MLARDHKSCFKCGEAKPLSAFYRHPMMGDGHLNKCKECTKNDVSQNRTKRVDYYREYDRRRGNRQTDFDRWWYQLTNPKKVRAHREVNRERKAGRLAKAPCMICGAENVHAHHDNYARPLDVVWLCPAHHKERHKGLR